MVSKKDSKNGVPTIYDLFMKEVEGINKKIERIETKLDTRFVQKIELDAQDKRIEDLEGGIKWAYRAVFGSMLAFVIQIIYTLVDK